MKKKIMLVALAVAVLAVAAIGGTLAWLSDKTDEVVNTFTVGDVEIALTETTGTEYTATPGTTVDKDPVVTVDAGSESCYVYLKVAYDDNSGIEGGAIEYAIADGWTALDGVENVYYRTYTKVGEGAGASYPVLVGDKVTFSDDIKNDTNLTGLSLTFQAYAIQNTNTGSAAEAWAIVSAE